MDSKLGIDKKGDLVIGSVWDAPFGGTFRITKLDAAKCCALLMIKRSDGGWESGHQYSAEQIKAKWKLVALPVPPDPSAIPEVTFLVRTRHEEFEKIANELEAKVDLKSAKVARQRAAQCAKVDADVDVEERAIKMKSVIREDSLKNLSAGDRKCYEMKPLRDFVYYNDQMPGWKYWIT